MTAWIVCADSARARIFKAESADADLVEVCDLLHPRSRLRPQDVVSDRPGRQSGPAGHAHHGVGGERDDAHKDEVEHFAREVAQELDTAVRAGHCQRVHLLAAPAFLGMLRKHLSDETREAVSSESALNVAAHSVADIRRHLPKRL